MQFIFKFTFGQSQCGGSNYLRHYENTLKLRFHEHMTFKSALLSKTWVEIFHSLPGSNHFAYLESTSNRWDAISSECLMSKCSYCTDFLYAIPFKIRTWNLIYSDMILKGGKQIHKITSSFALGLGNIIIAKYNHFSKSSQK